MPSQKDDPGQICSKCFRLIIFLWVPFGMWTRKSSCNNFEFWRKLFDLWPTPKGQFTNGGFDQTLWCSHPKGKGKDLILPANLSRPLGRKSDVQKEKIWSGAFWPSLKIILPIKLRFSLFSCKSWMRLWPQPPHCGLDLGSSFNNLLSAPGGTGCQVWAGYAKSNGRPREKLSGSEPTSRHIARGCDTTGEIGFDGYQTSHIWASCVALSYEFTVATANPSIHWSELREILLYDTSAPNPKSGRIVSIKQSTQVIHVPV